MESGINPKIEPKSFCARVLEAGLTTNHEQQIFLLRTESLAKFATKHINKPLVIQHQDIDNSTIDNIVGYISNAFVNFEGFTDRQGIYHEPDAWIWADIIITSQTAVDLIQNKQWKLSNQYRATETGAGGDYHSIPYLYEIIDILVDNVAIVEDPRYEDIKIFKNSLDIKQNIVIDLTIGYSGQDNYIINDLMTNPIQKVKHFVKEKFTNSTTKNEEVVEKKEKEKVFVNAEGKEIPARELVKMVNAYLDKENEEAIKNEGLEGAKEILDLSKKYRIGEDRVFNGEELMKIYEQCSTQKNEDPEKKDVENEDEGVIELLEDVNIKKAKDAVEELEEVQKKEKEEEVISNKKITNSSSQSYDLEKHKQVFLAKEAIKKPETKTTNEVFVQGTDIGSRFHI